jgi:hypothetical protein
MRSCLTIVSTWALMRPSGGHGGVAGFWIGKGLFTSVPLKFRVMVWKNTYCWWNNHDSLGASEYYFAVIFIKNGQCGANVLWMAVGMLLNLKCISWFPFPQPNPLNCTKPLRCSRSQCLRCICMFIYVYYVLIYVYHIYVYI